MKSKRGQGMTEYVVILAIIVAVLLLVRQQFKPQLDTAFQKVGSQIQSATT